MVSSIRVEHMHELSVTEALLNLALENAPPGCKRIAGLHLVIGQLSSIVDDSVQFYWDFLAEGTIAEGAALIFRRIPAELRCRECEHRFSPDGTSLSCPQCKGVQIEITAGEEFSLEAIEVE